MECNTCHLTLSFLSNSCLFISFIINLFISSNSCFFDISLVSNSSFLLTTVSLNNSFSSLTILLKCNKEEEIYRRKKRTLELNRDTSELYDDIRSQEFKVNVLSKEDTFDLVIESQKDYSYSILQNRVDNKKG